MARRSPRIEPGTRTWGGRRKGAGRKPKGDRAGVSHRPRQELGRRLPVHVMLRAADHVWSLRDPRCLRAIEEALYQGAERFEVCVVKSSVQEKDIHLLVEADDRIALSRAVKGLSIRLAKGLNRLMERRGRIFADRFQSRVLRTTSEVRQCLDDLASDSPTLGVTLPSPSTRLLRAGSKKEKKKDTQPP